MSHSSSLTRRLPTDAIGSVLDIALASIVWLASYSGVGSSNEYKSITMNLVNLHQAYEKK